MLSHDLQLITLKTCIYYSTWHLKSKYINLSEISCPDDKFNFVLEASRRSNMTCLQLYTKEVEAFPGESAASSLSFRHLNGQGGVSSISCKTQVYSFLHFLFIITFMLVESCSFASHITMNKNFPLFSVSGSCEAIVCMERFNG